MTQLSKIQCPRGLRWLFYAGLLVISSVGGWFASSSIILPVFEAYPPHGRDWAVGSAALAACLAVTIFGAILIKRRLYHIGFVVAGFSAGCAALLGFLILLLKVLPSC